MVQQRFHSDPKITLQHFTVNTADAENISQII